VNIRANDLVEKVSSSLEAKVRVKSPSPVQNLAAEVKEADVGLEESPEGKKDEEKPKPFTKVPPWTQRSRQRLTRAASRQVTFPKIKS